MLVNVLVLLAVLAAASVIGLWWRRRNGHFRGAPSAAGTTEHHVPAVHGETLRAEDLGAPLGERATLLQFSSAFCAPCRATRRTLADVAEMVPGVEHIEIDAEHHLGLVRRLNVLRTPTTFVLTPDGLIATRASGAPRKADVIAALGRLE